MKSLQEKCVLKGALAGMAGGLVASWAMNEFQSAWSGMKKMASDDAKKKNGQESEQDPAQKQKQDQPDDATMKAADGLSRAFLGKPLSKDEKKKAGPIVHYAFGTLMGGVYGALAEESAITTAGFGSLYGTALFVGADEIAVPAFGLSQSPLDTPLSDHAYAWLSHLVYAGVTEAVRRGVRALL